jgi:hypothetical protein
MVIAIGALPGNAVAGHAPKVLFHAILTHSEPAPAAPVKGHGSSAAGAGLGLLTPSAGILGAGCHRVFIPGVEGNDAFEKSPQVIMQGLNQHPETLDFT